MFDFISTLFFLHSINNYLKFSNWLFFRLFLFGSYASTCIQLWLSKALLNSETLLILSMSSKWRVLMNCTINKYLFVLIMDHTCNPFFNKAIYPISRNIRPTVLFCFCLVFFYYFFLRNQSIVVYLCVLRTLFSASQFMNMFNLSRNICTKAHWIFPTLMYVSNFIFTLNRKIILETYISIWHKIFEIFMQFER